MVAPVKAELIEVPYEDNEKKDIKIEGDVSDGNVNVGGTQNFYGTVNIHGAVSAESFANRKLRIFISYACTDADLLKKELRTAIAGTI